MADNTRFTIANFEALSASLRTRTSSSGKTSSRYTLEVRADPITIDLDPVRLGQPVADAIADAFREGVEAIEAPAAKVTIEKREQAAKAYAAGARWATQRYSGGRIGPTPPKNPVSTRLFNDSGRFAKSLFARGGKTGEWVISWAANRFSGHAADQVPGWIHRLRSLVPILGDMAELGRHPKVLAAVKEAVAGIVSKASEGRLRDVADRLHETASAVGDIADAAED